MTQHNDGSDAIAKANESMPLGEVLKRLEAERAARADVVLGTKDAVDMIVVDNDVQVAFNTPEYEPLNGRSMPATPWAHRQIAARAGVPKAYYDRMRDTQPDLLVHNIRTWWREEPDNRLVRAINANGDSRVRAWLSDQFRVLDNIDFITTVLNAVEPFNARVRNSHVNDDRLHIQLVTPRVTELPRRRGEAVQQGITIRNSEVGDGRILIQPWVMFLVCLNGMMVPKSYGRRHVGSSLETGVLSEETIRLESASVWAQVGDWARYALDPKHFEELVAAVDEATTVRVPVVPKEAVANVTRNLNLTRAEGYAVLERYIQQDDPTQFGVAQAVTYVAHTSVESFRRRVELEESGGDLMASDATTFTRMVSKTIAPKEVEKLIGVAA